VTALQNGRPAARRKPAALYRGLDVAAVRVPAFPIEFYEHVCAASRNSPSADELLADPRVRFALDTASPDLVRALETTGRGQQQRDRAQRKFRRYLVRMSTRTTPFAALAGVGLATFGSETTLRLDETRTRYHQQLDLPWLLRFVHEVESDPAAFRQLRLWSNPATIVRGGRAYIRETSALVERAEGLATVSIRASPVIVRALGAARTLIGFDALVALLGSGGNVSPEKVEALLVELWLQGFLFTELRPPLTAGDPAHYVARKLHEIDGASEYIARLEHALSGAPHPDVGRTLLHVESILALSGTVNSAVRDEAARAAELLLSLSQRPSGPPHLDAYRRAFVERYGPDREVSLLELIDPEFGLGLPAGYDGKVASASEDPPPGARRRRETLFELAKTAREQRVLEVTLDGALLARLRSYDLDATTAPPSLEISLFVVAASARELDQGHFTVVVGPNVGAMESGRSLGRFTEGLGIAGVDASRAAAQATTDAVPEACCVELSYLPRKLALANILQRCSMRPEEIVVGVSPGVSAHDAIKLDDLLVSVRGGRFSLRTPHRARRIHVCSGHMGNPAFAPSVCRFLTELSQDGAPIMTDFGWGTAAMLDFLPRVRVDRIVLSPAKWRIHRGTVSRAFILSDAAAFRSSLDRWRAEWNAPRYVHLTEGDNRLLLDLEHDADTEDLRIELARLAEDDAVILEEVYPGLDEHWLEGAGGRFATELIVSLVRNASTRSAAQLRQSESVPSRASRLKAPGSDWLYLKLYAPPSLHDDLIRGPLCELARAALQGGLADRWFFIRYADPEPHLRLRFHGPPAALWPRLLGDILTWSQGLVDNDLVSRFSLETYEREIERYGGEDAVDEAETLFCADSEAVAGALGLLSRSPLRREELAVRGLDVLFASLGCSRARRRQLLLASAARKEAGPVYRERRGIILAALDDTGNAASPAIVAVGNKLEQLHLHDRLTLAPDAIYRSFAHMHCNRLGLNAEAERLAYGLLVRAYETLQAKEAAR
jgi:lantibiotic biosynthesis protein